MGTAASSAKGESTSTYSPNIITPASDKYTGCIVGQALGDALGFLVEGEPQSQCKVFVKNELHSDQQCFDAGVAVVHRATNKGIPLGQISDDTQMARELMKSFCECGTFNPENYASHLSKLFQSGKVVGCGLGTAKAVAKLGRGIAWDQAGLPQGSAGNGSAIRAAPIGLMAYDNTDNMVLWAKQQAIITHQAGSIVIAGAIAICLTHQPLPPPSYFLTQLAALCKECSDDFAEALEKLIEWIELPPAKAAKFIAKHGLDFDDGSGDGIAGFVTSRISFFRISPRIESVLWALYSFLNNKDSYWDAIKVAIAAGGDTDSTAAMTGALSGAYLGLQQLPSNWIHHICDKDEWHLKDFVHLGQQCYDIKFPPQNNP